MTSEGGPRSPATPSDNTEPPESDSAGAPGATVFHLEDIHYVGPNTDLPGPPTGLAYPDYDDWQNRELLIANGIEPDEAGILAALRTQEGILLSAAAHCAYPFPSMAPSLQQIMAGDDDDAAVEAAYALARQGSEAGRDALRESMVRPIGPYLSPVLAAGHLARLGDLSGEPVIRAGLESEFLATKMLSAKQLYFFAPESEDAGSQGNIGNEWSRLVAKALADDDPTIQREILLQLRSLQSPTIVPLIRSYLARAEDPALAARAREILDMHTDP